MSCLSSPPASLFFFARHVMPLVGSGTLSRVPITVPGSIRQNMLCVSSLRAAVGSSRLEHSFLVVRAILQCHRKHELGAAQKNPGKVLKPQSHDASERTSYALDIDLQSRPLSVPFMLTMQDQDTNSQIATPMFVENSVDTLIDILHTQAFVENQIEDSREHTRLPLLLP